jgi:hypothetical protein
MYGDPADTVVGYHTWCPGCRSIHPVYVTTHVGDKQVHHCAWSFNGDLERPTFSPSLLVYGHKREDGSVINPRCHSFITDGRWHFCGDCEHALAGQVVDMEEWADEMWDRRADV